MSAAAPAPVTPATNGVTSETPATTNNAGTADDAAPSAGQDLNSTPEEIGRKVFAGNLAYATTDEGLKTFFSAFTDDIVSSEVIHRGNRPAGYGFVTFKTTEAADQAVADLNDKELDGRPLMIQIAKPNAEKEKERSEKRKRRTTGRRNTKAPPGEVTEAEAEGQTESSTLQKAENAVEGVAAAVGDALKPKKKKKSNRKPRSKRGMAEGEQGQDANNLGEAPVAGESTGAAEAPPKRERKPRAPRPPRAPRAPRAVGEQPEGEPSKNMLFVANLAFAIDDERLKEIFTDAGIDVVSARVVQRRWGPRRSKGFGFVDVGNEEEQKKALAYFAPMEGEEGVATGKEVEGRQIAVKVAVDTPKKEYGETDADAAANSAQKDDDLPAATVVAH